MNLLGNRPIVGKQWAQALAVTSVALLGVISAAAGTFSVQVAPQTAPMITSAGATPQLPSQQNGGGTEMPASEAHVTPSPVPLPSPQPAQEQDLPGYYKTGNGVSAPIAIEAPPPQYDSVARAAKAEGVGIFQVGVGADGTVQMVRPVSGLYPPLHPSLIQSGVDTIRTWKFDPALKDGHPVPVQVKVEINFRLH